MKSDLVQYWYGSAAKLYSANRLRAVSPTPAGGKPN